ncbi:tyrosine-type recombinase/integrase [Caballeronia sp. S22]|uniref:tyrosine-type recombinase/integrase n=1 Tax=Caballeronia sp. S22 TaxID=3137182 RepID=UPI003530D7F8
MSKHKPTARDMFADTKRQLFTVVRDIMVPSSPEFDNGTGKYSTGSGEELPAMVFMQWPNGFPCVEVEMYLMWLVESGWRIDRNGGSVRQEAVKLSHLVRRCYSKRQNLWELNTAEFHGFLFDLLKEASDNGKILREANQVIEISDSCIRFYLWLQEAVLPHRAIADVEGRLHQIKLVRRSTVDLRGIRHSSSLHFIKNPEPSIRQDKLPMPKESIDGLFQTLYAKSDALKAHPRFARRFSSKEHLEKYLEFQRMTWEAILTVCLAIGCRPGELAEMKMSENLESMTNRKSVVLPTEKREHGASRTVPIVMSLVIRLSVYVKKHRSSMLDFLRRSGKAPQPNDAMFLNSFGFPLTKETITREFARLCTRAKLLERTCLSMFRHRAITSLVAIHLKEFCSGRSEVAIHAMNDSDYSTILAKVASITGHKDPESLRPYIQLGWKELGSFDTIAAAIKMNSMMLTVLIELAPNLDKVMLADTPDKEEYLNERLRWFKAITDDMKDSVEAFRHMKLNPNLQRQLIP